MKLPPIVTASGLVLLATPVSLAVAQETRPQASSSEVVVTGTFIRRTEGFTPASPVQEITKEDFDAHAPRTVADFFTQLPYSFNTHVHRRPRAGLLERLRQPEPAQPRRRRDAGAAELAARRARRGDGQQRRRELAGAADRDRAHRHPEGRRLVAVRLGCRRRRRELPHAPQLRWLRGAGAWATCATTATPPTIALSGIWGTQTEDSGIVVSFEHFNRAPFTWETYEIIRDRPGIEGAFRLSGWPARFSLPNRNAAGALLTGAAGATTIADPLCAQFAPSANTHGQPGDAARRDLPRQLPAECAARHQRQRRREPLPGLRRGAPRVQSVAEVLRRSRLPAHAHAARRHAGRRRESGSRPAGRDHSRLCALEHRSAR